MEDFPLVPVLLGIVILIEVIKHIGIIFTFLTWLVGMIALLIILLFVGGIFLAGVGIYRGSKGYDQ